MKGRDYGGNNTEYEIHEYANSKTLQSCYFIFYII